MTYTTNFKLPLYEANDPTNYLVTYNETMEKIDTDLHDLLLRIETGEVNDRQFTSDISAIKDRLDSAENLISTVQSELATSNANISKNTEDISTLRSQLVEQGSLIKTIRTELTALEENFENFKTGQNATNALFNQFTEEQANKNMELSTQISNNAKKQELKNTEFASGIAKNSNNPIYHTCYHADFDAVTNGSQSWHDTHSINLSKKFTEEEYENLKFTVIVTKQNMTTIKDTCIICGEYTASGSGFNANRNFDDTFSFSLELKFNSNKNVGFQISGLATETTAPTPWEINVDITFSAD